MTLKEKVFKLREIKNEITKLVRKRVELEKSIPSITLNLTQDWEKVIKEIKDIQEEMKRIKKQEEILEKEYEGIQRDLLQLLYELNLTDLNFDLGDMLIKVSRLTDKKIDFIYKKENIGVK